MEIKTEKAYNKIVEKIKKSRFQNCCNCKFFPKFNELLGIPYIKIQKWYWQKQNIEVLDFICKYLRKRISQATKPFKSNCCLCYEVVNNNE